MHIFKTHVLEREFSVRGDLRGKSVFVVPKLLTSSIQLKQWQHGLLLTEKRKQLYCCSSSFGHRSRVYGIKCNRFFPDLDSSVLWGTG